MPSQLINDDFFEDSEEEGTPCCDNPKICNEYGFHVCLNCGFVYSRILRDPALGWGDPSLQDDPWVEKCGYYNTENLNSLIVVPNSNDSLEDNSSRSSTQPLQEDEPRIPKKRDWDYERKLKEE